MTEMTTEITIETPAEILLQELDNLTDKIVEHDAYLNTGFVRLGVLVQKIRTEKCWKSRGYANFGEYVQYLAGRVKRKRSYIYQCKSIAEKLLPQLSEETLGEMGISKANELKKLAVNSQKLIPQEVIDLALSGDTDEVKASVETILNPSTVEQGKWYDFGGFYLTESEREGLEEAYDLALKTDPVVAHDIPEHIQKKEVVMRWCMEFLSTYGPLADAKAEDAARARKK